MSDKKKIKQNEMTNNLLSVVAKSDEDKFQKFDSLIFEKTKEYNLTPSTHRFLLYLCMRIADNGEKMQNFTLKEYMSVRRLTDRTSAREQLKRDINTLMDMRITFDSSSGEDFRRRMIIQAGDVRYGVAEVLFSDHFYEAIKNAPVMDYPISLLGLPSKFDVSFYIGTKLAALKRINKKDRRIAVSNLLKAIPAIPSVQDVEARGRHYRREIIKPFERGMDHLLHSELKMWHYEDKDSHTIEKPISWPNFQTAYICYTWSD